MPNIPEYAVVSSLTQDLQESELGSAHENEGSQEPSSSKPGRKKNPKSALLALILHSSYVLSLTPNLRVHSSQAARRDQNRIAQREFRLRKQQRVCLPFAPSLRPLYIHGSRLLDP